MNGSDEDLTRAAIERAFRDFRQYHEAVPADDEARVEQLGRLGRAVADELGADIGTSVVAQPGGGVWVCLLITTSSVGPRAV